MNEENENINNRQIPKGMKACKTCGKPIAKKAKVCPNCGAKQKGKLPFIISVIIVLALIGILAGGNKDSSKD